MDKHKLVRRLVTGMFRGGGIVFPFTQNFVTDANLSRWTNPSSVATVTGGKLVITPTAAELLTNGDMEAGEPPTGWTASQSLLSSVADERTGGAGSKSINVAKNGTTPITYQMFAETKGDLFVVHVWFKNIDATTGGALTVTNSSIADVAALFPSDVAWKEYLFAGWVTGVGAPAVVFQTIGNTNGQSCRFDDASVKKLTNCSIYRNFGASLVTVKANWTLPTNFQGGVDVCISADGNSFVRGIVSRYYNKAFLVKYVNGVFSSVLAATSITYAAGAPIEVRHTTANTFKLYYNNAQVGIDQTISDAEIINNTRHGIFSTGGTGAGCDAFFCS